jgi:exopolyphosphatase/guanosine-5'-triphosphate,3'-diphosphate pyrophosphatase
MAEMKNKIEPNSWRIAAALDVGSNTLRLIVARVERSVRSSHGKEGGHWRYQVLARGLATPRLGRGLTPGGKLDETAKQAAFERAADFVGRARDLGAASVVLAASQACRKAVDGAVFVARLQRELGLERAEILSGEQEARLSRLGALSRLTGGTEGAWLADVGGGSSEFLPLEPHEAENPLSLELGAVSLTERHIKGDPPTAEELKAAAGYALQVLEPVRHMPIKRLVATAGTAATLASLVLGLEAYQPERVDNLVVTREELDAQISRLAAMPLSSRKRVTGLEPERADIILAGLIVLNSILTITELNRLTVMDAGLLEGILLDSLDPRP